MSGTIKPSDFKVTPGFLNNAFDDAAAEEAAEWIIRYCQDKGGNTWKPFSLEALQAYYRGHGRRRATLKLNYLTRWGYVTVSGDQCAPTVQFAEACSYFVRNSTEK